MKKITEHTYGAHIYMRISLNGAEEEIDAYITPGGMRYKTTADEDAERREEIIKAFNVLY